MMGSVTPALGEFGGGGAGVAVPGEEFGGAVEELLLALGGGQAAHLVPS